MRIELLIERAFPVQELDETQGTTDVEMDPGAEVATREAIEQAGLVVIGWYHSHPTFEPIPSVIDITNQAIHQGHNRNLDRIEEYEAPPRPGRKPGALAEHEAESDDEDDEAVVSGRGAVRGAAKMASKDELYVAAIISPYGVSTRSASSQVRGRVRVRVRATLPG